MKSLLFLFVLMFSVSGFAQTKSWGTHCFESKSSCAKCAVDSWTTPPHSSSDVKVTKFKQYRTCKVKSKKVKGRKTNDKDGTIKCWACVKKGKKGKK